MQSQESNTSKVVKGLSSQTVVTITMGVLEILSFSIMSRLLTQEDFGYYAAIAAVTTIFASFSEAGIGSALIQKKDLSQSYINNAFTISFGFGAVVSLLLFFLATPLAREILDSSLETPLRLMSITLLCNCLTSVNISMMQRKLQFIRVGLINLVALVVTTVVAVILAIRGYGFYAILTKAVLTSLIALVLSSILAKTKYRFEFQLSTFKTIFSFSGWLMASGIFRNLSQQVDRLMMGRLLSVSALGMYNRPKEFIHQLSTKLNSIFDTVLFPVLSSIQDDLQKLRASFVKSLYYLNIFSMLLSFTMIANSELIIRIFLGSQWLNVNTIFIIIALSILFNIDGRLADCYLRSLGYTKDQFFFRVAETMAKIIGVVSGVYWGVIGVAIGIFLSDAIMKTVKICYVSVKLKISILDTIKEILQGWRFMLFVLPVNIAASILLPHTVQGNCLMAGIFTLCIFAVFLIAPKAVGERYAMQIYPVMIDKIKRVSSKLKRKP